MGWWDTANDPNASTWERARAGLLCGAVPLACALTTEERVASARESVAELGEVVGGEGLGDQLRRTIEATGNAAAAPANAFADVLMWGAVILGGIIALVLLGLLWWYVLLPFIDGGAP